jgi:hypothetical protein
MRRTVIPHLQPRVASQVASRTIAHIMAHAVKLDRQPRFRAIEVEHVRTYRMLATKNQFARCALA